MKMAQKRNLKKIIESLSPNERKLLPYLEEKNIVDLCKKSNLNRVAVLRSLKYLKKKKIIELGFRKRKVIELGVNGALYKRKGLPERRLLNLLSHQKIISLEDAEKIGKLSRDELKASIGVLKRRGLIEIKNRKIILNASMEEVSKKSPEEIFLESLPLDYDSLTPEKQSLLKELQRRKNLVQLREIKEMEFSVTELGKQIMKEGIKAENLVEQITPEVIKSSLKGKKFRRYDVQSPVPKIYGGKRHFVNQAIEYAKEIWTEMGFKEVSGDFIVSSFWNFDALYTPQDHPARELQDTFFIGKNSELPNRKIVKAVKEAHENGVRGSKGWGYSWNENSAKKLLLRTHTTCLSSQTLAKLRLKDLPAKFFAIGKCFRNETVDWCHGFEFNQTEGIVVDMNANFRHLLGYLKQFAQKMGYKKVRFRPAYFPYTEPSLEGDVWDEEKGQWVELLAAGIFRPEVTIPLLGREIPVLAWGPGFDRMIMKMFGIKDLRQLYKNDFGQLKKIKPLLK